MLLGLGFHGSRLRKFTAMEVAMRRWLLQEGDLLEVFRVKKKQRCLRRVKRHKYGETI